MSAAVSLVETSGLTRIVPAGGDKKHRAACSVCKLGRARMSALERAFRSWTPAGKLAELYGLHPAEIDRHAHWYSLHLIRLSNLAAAYGQIIGAGIERAITGDATPDQALRALKALGEWTGQTEPSRPAAQPAGPSTTWEARVRMTRQGDQQTQPATIDLEPEPTGQPEPPEEGAAGPSEEDSSDRKAEGTEAEQTGRDSELDRSTKRNQREGTPTQTPRSPVSSEGVSDA